MFNDWLPFAIYGVFALAIPATMVIGSFVFAQRPHRRVRARTIPFESGVSQGPPQRQRFTVSFYLTAMLFILFDIEIVFLYPLAVILHQLRVVRVLRVPRVPRDPARRLRLHLAEGSARMALDKPLARPRAEVRARCSGRRRAEQVRGRGRRPRAEGRADDAREGRRVGADELDVARHVRARVLRDRDDVDRREPLRHRALRDGAVPRLAAPGRPADRLRPRLAQDGRAAAPDLRPDARAEVGDRDGRLRVVGRHVQQLRDRAVGRQDRRRSTCTCPAARRGPSS